MTTFYLSSASAQSALMVGMFFSLLLSLFLVFFNYDRKRNRPGRYLNIGIFLLLFVILTLLADAFMRIDEGLPIHRVLPIPIWGLWGITCGCDIYLIYEMIRQYRQKGKILTRNSVKQAMDTLPSAICYFSPSGAVKLCNLQMHRLFRSLTQSDLQNFDELKQALEECDQENGIIKLSDERQTYLFPDGKVWRYFQTEVTVKTGTIYTEAIFSEVTEQYEKHQELKRQTEQLKKISRDLKQLSDNVQKLTKEREVLAAKTKLHDQMGAGLIAIRQILRQNTTSKENAAAVTQFRRAIQILQEENAYPQDDVAEFIRDAAVSGIHVEITGELPQEEELLHLLLPVMREACVNAARHADASALYVTAEQTEDAVILHIGNDGKQPEGEIVPRGGLADHRKYIMEAGGSMEIQSQPAFMLTVTLPAGKQEKNQEVPV